MLSLKGYSGFKNQVAVHHRDRSNIGFLRGSWLSTNDTLGQTDFLRGQARFSHFITPEFWVGLASVGEWNKRKTKGTDTLRRSSYNFLEYRLFSGFGDTSQNYTELHYLERWDDTGTLWTFPAILERES
ncbi:MAG: hypothetical protein U5L96_00125 [Owenweeksia sp.]|nr:hypothetical protein [Owenweeksia sp.]